MNTDSTCIDHSEYQSSCIACCAARIRDENSDEYESMGEL